MRSSSNAPPRPYKPAGTARRSSVLAPIGTAISRRSAAQRPYYSATTRPPGSPAASMVPPRNRAPSEAGPEVPLSQHVARALLLSGAAPAVQLQVGAGVVRPRSAPICGR